MNTQQRLLQEKKKLVIAMIIIIFIALGYHFRYTALSCMQNFYQYRINRSIQKGNFTETERLYKQKLILPSDDLAKADTVQNLLKFCIQQRMYTDAEILFKKQIKSKKYYPLNNYGNGNRKLDLADTYNSMAFLYLNLKQYKNASEYANKALNIATNYKGKSHIFEKYIKSYEILCLESLAKQDYKKAQKYLQQIKYYAYRTDNGEEPFFNYYNTNMQYYKSTGEYDKAEAYAKRMYAAIPNTILPFPFQSQITKQNNYIIFINNNLGEIYYLQGKYKDAIRMFSIAYKISNEMNGQFHVDTICSNYHLLKTYKQLKLDELYANHLKTIKQSIRGYKILENTHDYNFEINMENFCDIYQE